MIEHKIEDAGKHKIVHLEGEVDLYCVGDLKKDLLKIIDEDESILSLVINLHSLKYMDSSGIALMANLQKKMKSKSGKLYLVNVNEDIMNVLRLSALDSFFSIYEDLESIP